MATVVDASGPDQLDAVNSPEPIGWRVVVDVDSATAELVADELFELGALGLEERAGAEGRVTLLAGLPDAAAAEAAAARVHGIVEVIADDSWADAWRAWARPVRVGDLLVRPVWLAGDDTPDTAADSDAPDEPVRYVVDLEPGRAFGSGGHESTRLALEVLLDQTPQGARVLDVGCGSGVLAVAAAVAKDTTVVAIDIDEHALEITRENAVRNGVGNRIIVESVSVAQLASAGQTFDVVAANILAVTLREIAPHVAGLVGPDGVLILSGMLAEQVASVDAVYTALGLTPSGSRYEGEWAALWYRRSLDQ